MMCLYVTNPESELQCSNANGKAVSLLSVVKTELQFYFPERENLGYFHKLAKMASAHTHSGQNGQCTKNEERRS